VEGDSGCWQQEDLDGWVVIFSQKFATKSFLDLPSKKYFPSLFCYTYDEKQFSHAEEIK
jgi:hypothetical protein